MSTLRALGKLAKLTAILFWTDPGRMLAATFHHYAGDRKRARRLINEIEAKRRP